MDDRVSFEVATGRDYSKLHCAPQPRHLEAPMTDSTTAETAQTAEALGERLFAAVLDAQLVQARKNTEPRQRCLNGWPPAHSRPTNLSGPGLDGAEECEPDCPPRPGLVIEQSRLLRFGGGR
ncbi:hypothetical protein GCM10010464_12810 [Pseudonocardia yunnanensis]